LTPEREESPRSAAQAAALLASAAAEGRSVRPVGGATKRAWGPPPAGDEGIVLLTGHLDEPLQHNEGDLTAVLGAGVTLAAAQERFAGAGQMLALDPPDPGGATLGGIVATADSGPLRHRYGGPRDLVLGIQVALTDGTVARAGSQVIKNVAGYDLAKLFCGSLGTLGVICEITVRLHPRPEDAVTARGATGTPAVLAAAARALARARLELDGLDVAWRDGAGLLLARGAGRAAEAEARAAGEHMRAAGLDVDLVADDAELWEAQRAGQRGDVVVKVAGLPTQLEDVLAATGAEGGALVGRAALGLSWIALPAADPDAVARLRAAAAPHPVSVTDGPPALRSATDLGGAAALMERVKLRFDPAGTLGGLP
jgi:glycolate dehydrogenase FAD-binding subunit